MAITNRYAGTCRNCNEKVAVNGGFVDKDKATGRWLTRCNSAACARALGIVIRPAQRVLTSTGNAIIEPYDAAALPLLRAFPGARWSGDAASGWLVSLKEQDRPRVLEIADQLGLDVDPSLRVKIVNPEVEAARSRAIEAGPYGDYQVEGVEFIARRDASLLADDMGLGKTFQALNALPVNARAVVVSPASLKLNWRNETYKWRPDLKPVVLSGRDTFRVPEAGEVVIANYDILPGEIRETKPKWAKGKSVNVAEVNVGSLSGCWLIVDEAHKVKNTKAKRSLKLAALREKCDRLVYMTGTPLEARPMDLWGILKNAGLEREVFGSWKGFVRCFQGYSDGFGMKFRGPLPEVTERLRRVMLRRTKAAIDKQLPRKRYAEIIGNGLSDALRRELDEVFESLPEGWGLGDFPDFRRISRLRAQIAAETVPTVLEIAGEYEEQGTPLVVCSPHRAAIDALEAREGWGAIHGDKTAQERQDVVDRFQSGKLNGVALTIDAGGVGITLTRASHVLFAGLDWNPGKNAQAEDRVCRIGQREDSVLITRLIADHPLDSRLVDILVEKQQLIQNAVEDRYDYQAAAAKSAESRGSTSVATVIEESDEELAARLEAKKIAKKEEEERKELNEIREKIRDRVGRDGLDVDGSVDRAKTFTDVQKKTIKAAHASMVAVCDGAEIKDEVGFNRPDAVVMHWLFRTDYDAPEAYALAESILRHYPRQLRNEFPSLFPEEQNHELPQIGINE